MLPDEYMRHDATGLAGLLRQREVTAAELVAASRDLAQRANPAINAIVEMFGQAGPGPAGGVFGGVPFLVKDTLGLAAELEAMHPWAERRPPAWAATGTGTAA